MEQKLKNQIRKLLILFIVLLVLSGVTAFPLEWELSLLNMMVNSLPESLGKWIALVYRGIMETNSKYPFMAYGTDWLAFAHIVIAIFFIAPLKDPIRNVASIKAGMLSCLLVFVLAFTAGTVRGIPIYWQLIDCSFGVGGFALLFVCFKKIEKLELIKNQDHV